jgi:hypothetical protein
MDFLFFNFVPIPQQYHTKDGYGFFLPEDDYIWLDFANV